MESQKGNIYKQLACQQIRFNQKIKIWALGAGWGCKCHDKEKNMEWKNNWLWNQEIPRSIEYEWKKDVNVVGINEFDTFDLSGGQIEFERY